MTWRSEAMLTARDPSTTRCTSSSPISRSERATATTPVEFWDQMCVPPSETTTDSMRWPAMRSADTAASWMAAIVLSRLTTTPLRSPSQRASPTPMTLTAPPTSSDSAMITATRLVPRSRPTVFFRLAKLVTKEGQAGSKGHVGDQAAEEDARLERAGDVGLEGPEDRVERGQQRDGCVARICDGDGDRRQDPEQRAEEREQDRDDDYLH